MTVIDADHEAAWPDLNDVDKLIHEPARLAIMAILSVLDSADFLYLQRSAGLTKGNLSSHLSRLEEAGYVAIDKTFDGKIPRTLCRLTDEGRESFNRYTAQMKGLFERLP